MASEFIILKYGQKQLLREYKQCDKLQVLKDYVTECYQLNNNNFTICYKKKNKEEKLETEKQYLDVINKENVREFYVVEVKQNIIDDGNQNKKEVNQNKTEVDPNKKEVDPNKKEVDPNKKEVDLNKIDVNANKIEVNPNKIDVDPNKSELYLDIFMKILFTNNLCCNNNQNGCMICFDKQYVQPENFKGLVLECLYEMMQNQEFKKICEKLFQKNIYEVDQFLELFYNVIKPKTNSQINIILSPRYQQPKYIPIPTQIKQQQQPNKSNIVPTQIIDKSNIQSQYIQDTQTIPQSIIIKQDDNKKDIKQTNIKESQSQLKSQLPSKICSKIIPSEKQFSVQYEYDEQFEFKPNIRVSIEITVINNGRERWPQGVYIRQVRTYPYNCIYTPVLNPNQDKKVKLEIITPKIPDIYNYDWALFFKDDHKKEHKIGEMFQIQIIVKDLSDEKKIEILKEQPDLDESQVQRQFKKQFE